MPLRVYNASFFQRLRDAFDIKGKHEFLLDEIIVPVVVVESLSTELSSEPEDCTYQTSIAATVGDPGSFVLLNELDSGWNILIDKITMGTGVAATEFVITLTEVAPVSAIAGGAFRKTWNNANQPSTPPGTAFADDAAGWAGAEIFRHRTLNQTVLVHEPKVVIPPGQEIAVQNTDDNAAFTVTMNARAIRIL